MDRALGLPKVALVTSNSKRVSPDGITAGVSPDVVDVEGTICLQWYEAGHQRRFAIQLGLSGSNGAGGMLFRTDRDELILLEPMTLDRYEAYLRPLTAGSPTFKTERELFAAFFREW